MRVTRVRTVKLRICRVKRPLFLIYKYINLKNYIQEIPIFLIPSYSTYWIQHMAQFIAYHRVPIELFEPI